MATEKEIQDWLDSGPITREMLELWLLQTKEGESNE
jgi:hypothetical protein